METKTLNPDKTVASLIHLSTFSKYFIPFGNFIFPLILWTVKKEDKFVDEHGKQALNFQISIFLYFIFLVCVGISGIIYLGLDVSTTHPYIFEHHNFEISDIAQILPLAIFIGIISLFILALLIVEIVSVIMATIKASEGEPYKYPITINFIPPASPGIHQSKNDQFNNTQNQTL